MLVDLKPETENFSYEKIKTDYIITIPEHQQMAIFGICEIVGTLELVGTLVIRD